MSTASVSFVAHMFVQAMPTRAHKNTTSLQRCTMPIIIVETRISLSSLESHLTTQISTTFYLQDNKERGHRTRRPERGWTCQRNRTPRQTKSALSASVSSAKLSTVSSSRRYISRVSSTQRFRYYVRFILRWRSRVLFVRRFLLAIAANIGGISNIDREVLGRGWR
jgi:hypothetical protein